MKAFSCSFTSLILLQVSKLAGVLSQLGVGEGDRVLIYMPMISEAVEAMLATIRLGAIHSVVFGGNLKPYQNRRQDNKQSFITHYSKSQFFVQKFNFDKTPTF